MLRLKFECRAIFSKYSESKELNKKFYRSLNLKHKVAANLKKLLDQCSVTNCSVSWLLLPALPVLGEWSSTSLQKRFFTARLRAKGLTTSVRSIVREEMVKTWKEISCLFSFNSTYLTSLLLALPQFLASVCGFNNTFESSSN